MSQIPKLDRRRPASQVTAPYEDGGLFKGGVIQATLALVPVFGTSSRGDATVRGFVDKSREVTVIFAGRRRPHFEALYTQLRYLFAQANYTASVRNLPPPDVNSIRLQVQCEGSWRAHIEQLEQGQSKRYMQFLAARWGFRDSKGKTLTFGTGPIVAKDTSQDGASGIKMQSAPSGFGSDWTSPDS